MEKTTDLIPPTAKSHVPLPREVLPVLEINDLLITAATRAMEEESSGANEIRNIVLQPIRVEYHKTCKDFTLAALQGSPLKGSRDLQLRAHVVNQVMIRDFYSGHRGQHMKEWVNSLYYVSDWLWESYREGAAPELNVVESIPSRRPIPYTPQPIDFVNAPPATKEIFYKQHIRSDPYQPFESYSVKTVHPYFENCSTEEIVSIRVKKTPNALQCTETAMHHFMRMLQLETQHGVLDADNTND